MCALQVPPPSLGHDMAQLLESGQAADVRFKVEEEELAAHKFILTARSPVFRSVAYTVHLAAKGPCQPCICFHAICMTVVLSASGHQKFC